MHRATSIVADSLSLFTALLERNNRVFQKLSFIFRKIYFRNSALEDLFWKYDLKKICYEKFMLKISFQKVYVMKSWF